MARRLLRAAMVHAGTEAGGVPGRGGLVAAVCAGRSRDASYLAGGVGQRAFHTRRRLRGACLRLGRRRRRSLLRVLAGLDALIAVMHYAVVSCSGYLIEWVSLCACCRWCRASAAPRWARWPAAAARRSPC